MPSIYSAPARSTMAGKISLSNPVLNRSVKPTDGFTDIKILLNSSVILSCEIILMRCAASEMPNKVAESISNPSCDAKRMARIILKGSSLKVFSGAKGVLIICALRSSSPLNGSTTS